MVSFRSLTAVGGKVGKRVGVGVGAAETQAVALAMNSIHISSLRNISYTPSLN